MPRVALVLVFLSTVASESNGQMFSYGVNRPQAVQSVSFSYTLVDFSYNRSGIPEPSFEFEAPIYGIVYTRPNVVASLGYGADDTARDLRLLEASIFTWGEFRLAESARGRLYLPIVLHTNYRRVAPRGEEDSLVDAFNITVLGLGSGLGYHHRFGDALLVHLRAFPVIGLALRAFGDSAGSSRLIDGGLHLHAPRLVGKFGVTAGYGFRAQVWNIGESSLVPQNRDDIFDYAGSQHVLQLGINW